MKYPKLLLVAFAGIMSIIPGFVGNIYAQAPPFITPGNWILDTAKSDEFNGTSLDTSKWWPSDPCTYIDSIRLGANGSEGAFFRPENVSVSNGNLLLKVDNNPDSLNFTYPCVHYHSYPFNSGGISTIPKDGGPNLGLIGSYSYGYYEIRAQLPGYYDSLGNSVGYGFYPNFWVAYQYRQNNCIIKHDEVDILEPDANQYYDARTNEFGVWDEQGSCVIRKVIDDSVRSPVPLFDGYHKIALELLPDKIILYEDDSVYYYADTLSSPWLAHAINMAPYLGVNISLAMGGYDYSNHPPPDAPFPEYFKVDYFRYYELNPNYDAGITLYQASPNTIYQNSPNPFRSTTEIDYSVDDNSTSSFINIYNMLGMEVKSIQVVDKGKSKIILDNTGLASGMYWYRLVVDNSITGSKKLIVLK